MKRLLVALVVLGLLGGGCGSDSSDEPTERGKGTTPRNLVSTRDVEMTKAGTPERTVMAWFQAAQFGDLSSVRELSTRAALNGIENLELQRILRLIGPALARPKIQQVRRRDDRATVRVLLLSYRGDEVALSQPDTLLVQRVGGDWLIADVSLLRNAADAVAAPGTRGD